jgi:hypothetical protein
LQPFDENNVLCFDGHNLLPLNTLNLRATHGRGAVLLKSTPMSEKKNMIGRLRKTEYAIERLQDI